MRVESARTRGAVGLCLEVHDLIVSKYAAGREKDREFVRAAIGHGLVDGETLTRRVETTPLDTERRALILGLIDRDFRECAPPPVAAR